MRIIKDVDVSFQVLLSTSEGVFYAVIEMCRIQMTIKPIDWMYIANIIIISKVV